MILLIFIILTNILVLSKLNFFPYPELFVYPYLTNHGFVPYRDILDQHFPGLMFFPFNLGNLGMDTPIAARFLQYGVVIITHIVLYLVAKKFLGKKAILANIFFALWQPFFEGWVLWIDSFLPILTLSSLYFLKSKKFFWSGLFLGLALLFKQVALPLIVIVGIYILFSKKKQFKEKKFKPAFYFGFGVVIPTSLLFLYIANLGIWKDFIFWTVTFNMTTFAEMGRKYGTLSEWGRVIGVYGFSLFAVLNKRLKEETFLIGIFLVGSLASIFARFDFVHLQPSLPFVALLSAFSVIWLFKKKYLRILIAVYALASIFLLSQFYKGRLGDNVYFFGDKEVKVVAEIQKLSRPDEKIFTLGTLPHIYYMADRLPSGEIFVFQFPWFMTHAENRILDGIVNDPPAVIIRDLTAEVEGLMLVSYMPKISEHIDRNYKVVNKVEEIEIMVAK